MKIKDNHYYILKSHPGISGFKRDTWEYRIVTGRKAKLHKIEIEKEYLANGLGQFRLEEGHLPEYQPIVSEIEALRWLDNEPFGSVFII